MTKQITSWVDRLQAMQTTIVLGRENAKTDAEKARWKYLSDLFSDLISTITGSMGLNEGENDMERDAFDVAKLPKDFNLSEEARKKLRAIELQMINSSSA